MNKLLAFFRCPVVVSRFAGCCFTDDMEWTVTARRPSAYGVFK